MRPSTAAHRPQSIPRSCKHVLSSALLAGIFVVAPSSQALAMTTAPPARDQLVYDHAVQTSTGSWTLLERLVNLDSGTFNAKGLDAVGAIVTDELKRLGAQVETVAATYLATSPATSPAISPGSVAGTPPRPVRSDNIVATFLGTGKARILLMAHTDTVHADGTAAARPFQIRDGRAYGPGVLDDKGSLVVGLQALEILKQVGFTDYARITLLVNTNEETGSTGSRALIEKLAREHDVVLNLEPGRPDDGLVIWRKGSGSVEVEVTGRTAHAGVAPGQGRNALTELSHQILQLGTLGDDQKQTSIHFTVASAGDRKNVIPDRAVAWADVRVTAADEFDRIEKDLARVSQNRRVPDTVVKTTLRRGFPPMPQNPQTDALAARAQAIYAELGRQLTLGGTGGASDASLSGSVGTASLDSFGLVGDGAHTDGEFVEVDSLVPRVYLLTRMIMELGAASR